MSQSVSISLVQQQFPIGAVRQNSQQVIDLAKQAGTDLVIFPELTLTGYPPEDLLYRADLLAAGRAGAGGYYGCSLSRRDSGRTSVARRRAVV